MKKLRRKINLLSKTAIGCIGFVIVVLALSFGVSIARAAWEEPSAEPPAGNIYVPLNTGPDDQAKKGGLLLDPFYNPNGSSPSMNYPLEVHGPQNVYSTIFEIENNLTVDTDTLYVDGETNHRVGMGTLTPATLLEVVGGIVSVGSAANPVTGAAVSVSSDSNYGAYGMSTDVNKASVYGQSTSGVGVYGLHTLAGYGIYAESLVDSAVIGTTAAPYVSNPATYVAGVYGTARGLGAWAGYFAQRLYGDDDIVGGKFVPNRLEYSQVPYTVGWEVQDIESSLRPIINEIVFDGTYIWAIQMYDWSIEPYAYLLDPATGGLVEEFQIEDSGGNVGHAPQEAILAGGYIWIANWWDDNRGLTRVHPTTHEAIHYQTGGHAGSSDGPVDIVYDGQSTGGPYIWVVNRHVSDSTYSVTRLLALDPTDPTAYEEFDTFPVQQCPTFDTGLCNNSTDEDGDTLIDGDDPDCTNPPISVDPANVGNVESVRMIDLNYPTGFALQPNGGDPTNPTFWISFGGATRSEGEGIAQFSASDPINTFTHHCIGPNRGPDDIVYGDNYIWVANNPHRDKPQVGYEGFTRFNPTTQAVDHYYFYKGADKIKFDDQSGQPYVWLSNYWEIHKYDTTLMSEEYEYLLPDGGGGFDFDYTSSETYDYVWSARSTSSTVTRSMIDNPYTTDTYLIKAALSRGMVFDGTYLWSINNGSNTVSKYRATDGAKVGDYEVGWYPTRIAFDGTYLWVRHHERGDTTDLAQIRVSDGTKVGDYDYTTIYGASDMVFDGTYLWVSSDSRNKLERVDLATCGAGVCTTAEYDVLGGPRYLAFDGENVWVTHDDQDSGTYNRFSKIDPNTISGNDPIIQTYYLSDAYEANDNLKAFEFDGTYLWLGTKYIDNEGNSVYKVRADNGTLAGNYSIYTEPGLCSGGDQDRQYCARNIDCTNGGTCSVNQSNVKAITFDGIQIWVLQKYAPSGGRECNDNYDNDSDGLCDAGGCCDDWSSASQATCGGTWLLADPECYSSSYDLHETDSSDYFGTSTDIECDDGIDNDGNGLCDFDGAVGSPGCSGKPDPGCASAEDMSEVASSLNATHLTRIMAATGEVVESIPYANYCLGEEADIVFDGTSVWFNEAGSGCDGYILHQYYAGSGLGLTDFGNTAALQSRYPGTSQAGSFSMSGSATFGTNLTVVGDLVVTGNTWAGAADNERNFGTGCDDGEFAKGVDVTNGRLQCRPL